MAKYTSLSRVLCLFVIYLYLLCTVTAFNEIFGQLQIYQADNFITQHAETIHVIKGSRSNGNGEYQLVNIDDEMSYDLRSGMLLTVKGHHVAKNTLPNITQIDKGHKLFNVTSIKLVSKFWKVTSGLHSLIK